jgi:hypothetical protein
MKKYKVDSHLELIGPTSFDGKEYTSEDAKNSVEEFFKQTFADGKSEDCIASARWTVNVEEFYEE